MRRILRRRRAEVDLEDIWLFVARYSPTAADRLIARLEERFNILTDNPMLGRPRPEFGPDVRSFRSNNYVVFYVPIENGVEILRVVHGARNIRGTL